MKTLAVSIGALAAVVVIHFAWNWESDKAREHEAAEPDPTPLRDRVAETLAGAAAGQASIVAEAEAITAHEAQPTEDLSDVVAEINARLWANYWESIADPLAGRERFQGPEDIA